VSIDAMGIDFQQYDCRKRASRETAAMVARAAHVRGQNAVERKHQLNRRRHAKRRLTWGLGDGDQLIAFFKVPMSIKARCNRARAQGLYLPPLQSTLSSRRWQQCIQLRTRISQAANGLSPCTKKTTALFRGNFQRERPTS